MGRRVLCITSNFPRWSGDETTPFVLNLAADLERLGWAVDVLAPHAPGAARRETLDGVRVERFRYLRPESQQTVCYQGGALINLRRAPSNWLKLPALVLAEIAALHSRLRSRRYDLVHSHWILPQGFAASWVAPRLGIPHVATAHGGDVFVLRGRMLGAFKRFALGRADAVTVNSSATAAALRELLPDSGRLHTIPMGVALSDDGDAARSAEIRERYRCGEGPLLVFVGRMVREKGVPEIIDAVALLRDRLPELRVLLVGEGAERAEFETRVERLQLGDRISFTGWVQPAEVPGFLAAADCYVGPSHTEAQGLTLLEAMSVGTPVVAARVGGVVDAVRHEQTGLLVEPGSASQVAEAVLRLQGDPDLRARLANNGRELVRTRYSRAASAASFGALFEALVDGVRSRVA